MPSLPLRLEGKLHAKIAKRAEFRKVEQLDVFARPDAIFGVLLTMKFLKLLSVPALSVFLILLGGRIAEAQSKSSVAEQYLFSAANAERVQRGVPALRWDATLYRAAVGHAKEMAARASISHQYPGEAGLAERGQVAGARFSHIAENVAEAPTAVRIHDAWMNSPGHRDNLLDPMVDSVGISVLSRDGQLYAVEDFGRSVAMLSLAEQESKVGSLLVSTAGVELLPSSEDVRRTCGMETGYAGTRRPMFVMRYTAGDLSRLPDSLKTELATGKFREAAVGACSPKDSEPFTAFHIAVLLYP